MSRDFLCFSDVSKLAFFILNNNCFPTLWKHEDDRWVCLISASEGVKNKLGLFQLSVQFAPHANISKLDYDIESYFPISYHRLKQVFHWTYGGCWKFDLFLPISHNKTKKGQKLFLIGKMVPLSLAQPCSDSCEDKKVRRSKMFYYISLILLLSIYTSGRKKRQWRGEKKKKKWFKVEKAPSHKEF